jgi:hypothetical protein
MAEKLLYQNGQSCGQFMFLSQEWPRGYGRNPKNVIFWPFLDDFPLQIWYFDQIFSEFVAVSKIILEQYKNIYGFVLAIPNF